MLQQHDAHVDLALDSRLVEGRVVPVVPRIGVSAMLEQQLHHLGVAKGAGVVQGNEAPVVLGVHVGAVLQKVLHHIPPAKPSSEVKRSGLPSRRIPRVNVMRGDQLLDTSHVTVSTPLKELTPRVGTR